MLPLTGEVSANEKCLALSTLTAYRARHSLSPTANTRWSILYLLGGSVAGRSEDQDVKIATRLSKACTQGFIVGCAMAPACTDAYKHKRAQRVTGLDEIQIAKGANERDAAATRNSSHRHAIRPSERPHLTRVWPSQSMATLPLSAVETRRLRGTQNACGPATGYSSPAWMR